MSKKSHVIGWENYPTPAQLRRLFQLTEEGWVTKKNLQALLRREHVILPELDSNGNPIIWYDDYLTLEQLKELFAQMSRSRNSISRKDLGYYLKGVYPAWKVSLSGSQDWMSEFFNGLPLENKVNVSQEIGTKNFPVRVIKGDRVFGILDFKKMGMYSFDSPNCEFVSGFLKSRDLRWATPYEFICFVREYGWKFREGNEFDNYYLSSKSRYLIYFSRHEGIKAQSFNEDIPALTDFAVELVVVEK